MHSLSILMLKQAPLGQSWSRTVWARRASDNHSGPRYQNRGSVLSWIRAGGKTGSQRSRKKLAVAKAS